MYTDKLKEMITSRGEREAITASSAAIERAESRDVNRADRARRWLGIRPFIPIFSVAEFSRFSAVSAA